MYVVNNAGIMTTFAGTQGVQGYYSGCGNSGCGDGGLAIYALLFSPIGVALDFLGNVYIGDGSSNVRVVTNGSGIITTYAGGGSYSYLSIGDGGPATTAYLSFEGGMAADVKGNVFIADTYDNRIRKVTNSLDYPTGQPTVRPSIPTSQPSSLPSLPTSQPSSRPSIPTSQPSVIPSSVPTKFGVRLFCCCHNMCL